MKRFGLPTIILLLTLINISQAYWLETADGKLLDSNGNLLVTECDRIDHIEIQNSVTYRTENENVPDAYAAYDELAVFTPFLRIVDVFEDYIALNGSVNVRVITISPDHAINTLSNKTISISSNDFTTSPVGSQTCGLGEFFDPKVFQAVPSGYHYSKQPSTAINLDYVSQVLVYVTFTMADCTFEANDAVRDAEDLKAFERMRKHLAEEKSKNSLRMISPT